MPSKTLPSQASISRFAKLVDRYPIEARQLKRLAQNKNLPTALDKLLNQFSDQTIFSDQADLETKLTDLEIILTQAQEEPEGILEVYEED